MCSVCTYFDSFTDLLHQVFNPSFELDYDFTEESEDVRNYAGADVDDLVSNAIDSMDPSEILMALEAIEERDN